jgi:hypothetical protein
MYVCLSVCLYVCMSVCLSVCLYVWMYGWMDGCMLVWMYGCMDVWMCVILYLLHRSTHYWGFAWELSGIINNHEVSSQLTLADIPSLKNSPWGPIHWKYALEISRIFWSSIVPWIRIKELWPDTRPYMERLSRAHPMPSSHFIAVQPVPKVFGFVVWAHSPATTTTKKGEHLILSP